MRKVLSLALLAMLVTPVSSRQDNDPRKMTPEEIARRRQEAFDDAAAAARKVKSWTGKIKVSTSIPSTGVMKMTQGTVSVKYVDEKTRWLYWEEMGVKAPEAPKPEWILDSRTLYKGTEYRRTDEKAKIVEKYDFSKIDLYYFAQMLARDGFSKDLEKVFEVNLIANARYMKTDADATDVDKQHLGGEKEIQRVKDKANAGKAFEKKSDEIDRAKGNKKEGPASDQPKAVKFYLADLTPTSELLKQDILVIHYRCTADFLPLSILIERNDGMVSVNFSDHQTDPKPDLEDSRFQLPTDGFKVKEPQKENN